MQDTNDQERIIRMKEWMRAHTVTYRAVGDCLGLTDRMAWILLNRPTIPTARRKQMLAMGFPESLLPVALDKPMGRPRVQPQFPFVVQQV